MKKLFITLIVSVLFVFGISSQSIANYTFSTATPNTLEIMSVGTTQLITGASTNVASALTGIGFPFYFMGVPYTQFSVNSNGQMSLGATVIPGTGIVNEALNTPLIVPMSGANTLLSTGKVHFMMKGIAPNRILVVEWKDLMIPAPGGINPPVLSSDQMQVILHETTGIIDFKYGIVSNNAAPTTARATFISSSNTATTVKSIGATMILANNAIPVSTYLMDVVNTNLLNLRTYTFTPPVALTAPTWAAIPFTAITATGLTLNWVNTAATQTAVNIYNSVDGGLNYNFVATLPATAVSYVATFPLAGTSCLWKVAAVNEGAAAYSIQNTSLAIPIVTVVNCGGSSTLTASGTTGTLLWSTGAITPSITVTVGGVYTVTQTLTGLISVPGSGIAIPVPTITGPVDPLTLMPATLVGGATAGQIYTTEPGMTGYVWTVSANGAVVAGAGTNSITVNWTLVAGSQTVSVKYMNAACATLTPLSTLIINYFPFAASIDPTTIPQFVDPMPHFAAGLRVNAKAGGNLIIKAVKVQQVALSTGTITSIGKIGDPLAPLAGKGNYAAYAISKDNGLTFGPAMWPAQTIEAQQGFPLTVQYKNELVGVRYSDFNILADQTLMMNGYPKTGNVLTDPYTGDIPMVVHLHGGEMPSGSDGGPTGWIMPTGNPLKGPGYLLGTSNPVSYPNQQEATTLWYHPHDQGLTRINVFTGLAGYYFIRGAAEETAKLPGWSGDDKVQEVTPAGKTTTFNGATAYLPEIELAVQDRMFNVKGELYWPVAPTNPDIHPFWTPEFFGDVMTVNGKSWPYLSVAARKYRFRVLGGCNARFLNMWLQNLTTNTSGPKITVIGTDGGLLDAPVVLDPVLGKTLFMAPGERYDVVIDFTGIANGTVFTLMNNAAAPYPTGTPVSVGTTDRIMQFVVNGNMVAANGLTVPADKSLLPANLRSLNPIVKLTNFAGGLTAGVIPLTKRQIILNEVTGAGGPVQVLFNNSHFDASSPIPGAPLEFGGPTEIPLEGTTELFTVINTTVDAHPIHIHLVQWQLVSHQTFNQVGFMGAYSAAWAAHLPALALWPVGLSYPGGSGSPYLYNTINADGAVGGNPAITPWLTGLPIAANPEQQGWKDDVILLPGEVNTYIVRFSPTTVPIGATPAQSIFPFDPSIGPGYVWHCHIVDHEDMDMMRPLMVKPSALRFPQMTGQPQPVVACIGSSQLFSVAATSVSAISYQWQVSTDAGLTWTNLTNVAPYTGVLTGSLTVSPIDITLSTKMYRALLNNIDGITNSNAALLTVLPAGTLASVTNVVSANNVFSGQSVTFTPTPVNGGLVPSYQWYKNTLAVATTPTYTYIPVNGDIVYAVMTSSFPCILASTSNSITMTVQTVSTAAINGDWNTPATWANNIVPTILDNVVIPVGKVITINAANANCKSLVVEGALTSTAGINTLTVNGNVTLTGTLTTGANTLVINGITSGTGTIDASAGTVVYGGTLAAQTVSNIATNVLNNLTINNKVGVTLPIALTASTTLTINAGAKLTNPTGANLTVKNVMINSDAISGPGTFVDNGTTTNIVGGVANVQQYLTGGRNWYMSSPVNSATSGSISTASLVQGFNEPIVSWIPESSLLAVAKGYAASVLTTGNVTFSGSALNTGVPANTTLTRTGVALKAGYNLIGNPYPSYLDWSLVNAGSVNMESTIWYRTRNAVNTTYVFDTYNATGNIGTSNNGTIITSQIPPMQAFWARVATGFVSGTIAMNNTMRSHEGAISNRLKAPEFVTQKVLRLQVSNGVNSDEAIVLFNNNALDGLDAFDSEKMTNGDAFIPEINTFAGNEPVVINGLNNVSLNNELSLGFTTGELNMFTIKATEISNFDPDTKILLKDKQLNVEKELSIGNDYTFKSDATTTSTRFSILFKSPSVVTGNINVGSEYESMFIFKDKNNQITVHRYNAIGEGTIIVFNSTGQKIVNIPTTGTLTLVDAKLLPGVYLVTVEVQGKSTTKKITLY